MANFDNLVLTNIGEDILSKVLSGQGILTFTKAQLGDGEWPSETDPKMLTSLYSPQQDAAFSSYEAMGDGTVKLRFGITNQNLSNGYYTREIGIFAKDPSDDTEKLYAVAQATAPDYIPTPSVLGIEELYDVYVSVGSATQITLQCSSIEFLTQQDLEDFCWVVSKPTSISGISATVKYGSMLTLTASGSLTAFKDNGDYIETYEWKLPDASTVTGNPINYEVPGLVHVGEDITFQVRAKSHLGCYSKWATVVATIGENAAPILDSWTWDPATPHSGNTIVTLTLQGHDPDGDPVTYSVTCSDASVQIAVGGSGNEFQVTYPDYTQDTTVTFTYRITDDSGAYDEKTEDVLVKKTGVSIVSLDWTPVGPYWTDTTADLQVTATGPQPLTYSLTADQSGVGIQQDSNDPSLFHVTFPYFTSDTYITFTAVVSYDTLSDSKQSQVLVKQDVKIQGWTWSTDPPHGLCEDVDLTIDADGPGTLQYSLSTSDPDVTIQQDANDPSTFHLSFSGSPRTITFTASVYSSDIDRTDTQDMEDQLRECYAAILAMSGISGTSWYDKGYFYTSNDIYFDNEWYPLPDVINSKLRYNTVEGADVGTPVGHFVSSGNICWRYNSSGFSISATGVTLTCGQYVLSTFNGHAYFGYYNDGIDDYWFYWKDGDPSGTYLNVKGRIVAASEMFYVWGYVIVDGNTYPARGVLGNDGNIEYIYYFSDYSGYQYEAPFRGSNFYKCHGDAQLYQLPGAINIDDAGGGTSSCASFVLAGGYLWTSGGNKCSLSGNIDSILSGQILFKYTDGTFGLIHLPPGSEGPGGAITFHHPSNSFYDVSLVHEDYYSRTIVASTETTLSFSSAGTVSVSTTSKDINYIGYSYLTGVTVYVVP